MLLFVLTFLHKGYPLKTEDWKWSFLPFFPFYSNRNLRRKPLQIKNRQIVKSACQTTSRSLMRPAHQGDQREFRNNTPDTVHPCRGS